MVELNSSEMENTGGFNANDFWTGVALGGTVLVTAATVEVTAPVAVGLYAVGFAADHFMLSGLGIPTL